MPKWKMDAIKGKWDIAPASSKNRSAAIGVSCRPLQKIAAQQSEYRTGQIRIVGAAIGVLRRPLQKLRRSNRSIAPASSKNRGAAIGVSRRPLQKIAAQQSEYRAGHFKDCARLGYQRIEGKRECAASSNGLSQRMGACANAWPNSDKSSQRIGAHVNAWLNSDRVSCRMEQVRMRGRTEGMPLRD